MRLFEHLKTVGEGQSPFHMPGHKRNGCFEHLAEIDYTIDFTETPDSDDLHHSEGILLHAQQELARLYGTERSFFCVNGSTGCILAAIRGVTKPGDRVLVARNCHKSVFNAIELCALRPTYLIPEINDEGFFSSISPELVQEALAREEGVRLVVITSPTYEGVISDIKKIADICHRYGELLLVDEAHGAHLGFFDKDCPGATALGADLVVQSFHKTLPSFTQTAVLHLCSACVDAYRVASQMALFQSSSPSYLLLSALDGCVHWMKGHAKAFASWKNAVENARKRLGTLEKLHLYEGTDCFGYDRSKICILTTDAGITGEALYELLYERGIVCEMAGYNVLLAMTGAGDSEERLNILVDALLAVDKQLSYGKLAPLPTYSYSPRMVLLPFEAFAKERHHCAFVSSAGRISGKMVYLYPPGIPLVLPGEEVSRELIDYVGELQKAGLFVTGADDTFEVLEV